MTGYKIKYCFVPSCRNSSVNSCKIFLTVPSIEKTRQNWSIAAGRTNAPKATSGGIYCCEDHFDMENDCENWMAYKLFKTSLKVKRNVLPHRNIKGELNIPKEYSQLTSSEKKRKHENIKDYLSKTPKLSRLQVRQYEETNFPKHSIIPTVFTFASSLSDRTPPEVSTSNSPSGNSPITLETTKKRSKHFVSDLPSSSLASSASSQVVQDSTESERTLSSTETSGDTLLEKHKTLTFTADQTKIIIREHSRFYLGLPQDCYCLVELLEKEACMTYINIFIILKKIRLNDAYYRLAVEFGLSVSSILKIINQGLPILASYFKKFIIWPGAREITLNLPIPFRLRYKQVQSIIKCFEIQIETPSMAVHHSLTWSKYKKANTLKYLISATPEGIVNFISGGFGGTITDTEIVKKCGFLSVLPDNCHVMADGGFKHVAALLQRNSCKLIRLPSVLADSQSTKAEVRGSKQAASLHIHIERVTKRLREFQMLKPQCCIDHQMVGKMDYIILIACGIINFQGPFIK